jgi:hypothetical protein
MMKLIKHLMRLARWPALAARHRIWTVSSAMAAVRCGRRARAFRPADGGGGGARGPLLPIASMGRLENFIQQKEALWA